MQPSPAKSDTFIPWAAPALWGNEQRYITEALSSTWISGGPFVERLEKLFVDYCGLPHAAAVSNGTTALHMVYLALGVGPGDEVICPGFGFLAAANVALHCGATPVFCEVDPHTWCMTAADVERVMTPRTKLIVPVHTYGNVCRMDEIMTVAAKRNAFVLEDAAESFASRYKGKLSGTIGHAGAFSFQATKTITTGEGGMVVTADAALNERMALYRSHGMLKKRYFHEVVGHNFRLTNLQAAVGCAQFEALPHIEKERRRVQATYTRCLAGFDGVTAQRYEPDVDPVLWAMAVLVGETAYPQGRDALMQQMRERNIETRPGFYPPTAMDIYKDAGAIPVCEHVSRRVISLPTFPTLSDGQIEIICATLKGLRR